MSRSMSESSLVTQSSPRDCRNNDPQQKEFPNFVVCLGYDFPQPMEKQRSNTGTDLAKPYPTKENSRPVVCTVIPRMTTQAL